MKTFTFSKEVVDAVVRYLASRPYAEVAPLLERLNSEAAPQLAPAPAPEASNGSKEEKASA